MVVGVCVGGGHLLSAVAALRAGEHVCVHRVDASSMRSCHRPGARRVDATDALVAPHDRESKVEALEALERGRAVLVRRGVMRCG